MLYSIRESVGGPISSKVFKRSFYEPLLRKFIKGFYELWIRYRVPVNAEATTLGFQRDLQTSHLERGDLKRVVEKEPKDSIPATIPIPRNSCPPPLTTPVQQVRFSMASPQVSLLPLSRNAARQAPPSQS
jgi:hypothetical protein